MEAYPVVALVTVQLIFGLVLGYNYLNGTRNKPTLIGMHFLLGAAALEIMALLLRGAPDGDVTPGRPTLVLAAALMAAALLTGLAGAMFMKPMPTTARVSLYAHVGIAIGAYGALVIWAFGA